MSKISYNKIKSKIWSKIVSITRTKSWYPKIYKSYWNRQKGKGETNEVQYFTAIPNRGAGIGHQLANWIAGYWFSEKFDLNFAHIPFSTSKWESFLDLGKGEKSVENLKKEGYKTIKIPLFNENNKEEVALIQKIIKSYANKKVVFLCEGDQYYKDQFGVIDTIQKKFYNAEIRKEDKLIYSSQNYNIAIHVRRGDIVIGQENNNPNLKMRWQSTSYFEKTLEEILKIINTDKDIHIYLFSQGKEEEFESFQKFPNLHLCLEMGAMDSFIHMALADVLITSKSSFSYKPALLNKGIKVVPANFWHGYPNTKDWIKVDDHGNIIDV